MKVLVADKFPEIGLDQLRSLGLDVDFKPGLVADQLADNMADAQILIVRSTKVSAAAFNAAKSLQLVVRAGAGVNTIDVDHASRHGVFVANCPGKNAVAVAELAMGLLLALDRRIPHAHAELKRGTWNKKEYSKADGLLGKTLGIVGLGRIGQEVVTRAQAFGLNVVGWSRSLTPEKAKKLGIQHAESLLDLASRCDAVSVHLAVTDETRGCIGSEFLAALGENGMLVNASRGGIVDEKALLQAIDTLGIRYAADVYDGEPGSGHAEIDHPVVSSANTVCTPHIGASTNQAQLAVADEAVRVIGSFVQKGEVPNCVNLCEQSPATWLLNVRHLDKIGVLASVLAIIRENEINVEELENVIFKGAQAACAKIQLSIKPSREMVQKIRETESVLDVNLVGL